jgi:Tol biopolymer transport system component
MLLATGVRYPPLSDLAQPMLRLAGIRINPNTNGPHRGANFVALTLKHIADGAETKVSLPTGAQIDMPRWSPDGKHFAFRNTTPSNSIELWVGDSATGQIKQLKGVRVNAVSGDPYQWLPDNRTAAATPSARCSATLISRSSSANSASRLPTTCV